MSTSPPSGCGTTCRGDCYGGCKGNCWDTCSGGCDQTAETGNSCGYCGASDCSSSCDNCAENCGSGCRQGCSVGCSEGCGGCTGYCENSCNGGCYDSCEGDCEGKCDKGCSTEALNELYLNLTLQEYIKYEDVYNLKQALENELTRRGKKDLITEVTFSEGSLAEIELAETIYNYFNNMGKGSVVSKEEQYELMHKSVFEAYIKTVKELHDVNLQS